ncbi:MAG: hypothetical protein JXR03_13415 [Cyclobacteriaceae bacterium]
MNKLFNYIALTGMVIAFISCAEPETPTATSMSYGDWSVDEFYVDGQSDGSGVISRFTLERDGSFVLEDNNNILFTGTWVATDNSLTLTESVEGGTVFSFEIIYQSFTKMQLVQTITSPTIGNIRITYLMNWNSATTY